MIQTIIFDFGGVVITLDPLEAERRFSRLGVANAHSQLDSYTQQGIFGAVESGAISADVFQDELSRMVGREVTFAECCHAWQGYAGEVPRRNLDALRRLRSEGYRLLLLSNTNPFMMEWAESERFDGEGHPVSHYFDAVYLSYQMKVMKPDDLFFRLVLTAEQVSPSSCLFLDDGIRNVAAASQIGICTYCPKNGEDWTHEIYQYLK